MKALVLLLAFAGTAFGQQICTQHVDFSMGAATGMTTPAAGNTLVQPIPGDTDRNIQICAVYLSVTQGTTPANFQLRGCTDNTCSAIQTLTPLFTGHASYLDTYNSAPWSTVEPVLRGRGIYLYLSSAPTAANVQVFYNTAP